MNVTPVIVRELRAEARNPVNYWIRVVAVALMLLPIVFLGLVNDLSSKANGKDAFVLFTSILFFAAWIIIPITISDCISRERREGTLGLLFLTPLNAREILLGKSAVNIARSLIVFFAALPILAIPILMGGVSPEDILRATFFNGAALVLALAASLAASAVSKHRTRAVILSLALCVLLFSGCFLFPISLLLNAPLEFKPLLDAMFKAKPQVWRGPGITPIGPLHIAGIIFLISLLTLLSVIFLCAVRLQKSWQDKPLSARQQRLYHFLCSPRFLLGVFRKWQQRKLTRNPVGWLQSYSWSARLSAWGWCGVIIFVESFIVITSNYGMLAFAQSVLQTALLISIAFSAVNSFQRERQTGALELILVTPIREKELILGRLRGIWEQFLPAFLVFLFSTWYMQDIYSRGFSYRNQDIAALAWVWSILKFLSIPVVGLYFGLRFRSMLGAWFLTFGSCLLLPSLLHYVAMLLGFRLGLMRTSTYLEWMTPFYVLTILFLVGLSGFAWSKTAKLLRERSFVLSRQ